MASSRVVAVIGAGFSGVACAAELQRLGFRVVLLEASGRLGGRAFAAPLAPAVRAAGRQAAEAGAERHTPLELGAEFLHGEVDNAVADVVRAGLRDRPGARLVEVEWPQYLYYGKEGRLVDAARAERDDADLREAHEALYALGEAEPGAVPEQSVLQWLAARGVRSRVLDMVDAVFANDYCAEMSDLGAREVCVEQRAWRHGEKYMLLDGCTMADVCAEMARPLRDVRLGWEAASVRVEGGRVRVTDRSGGRHVEADRVVVTVPLPLLRDGALAFEPPLPPAAREATRRVAVRNAVKVFVRVARPFWPDDFWDVVCADSFCAEIWLAPPARFLGGQKRDSYTLVGFVTGGRADRVAALPQEVAVHKMLCQLNAIFGSLPGNATPATDAFLEGAVQSWAGEPLARGAYSAPTVGAHESGARAALAAPAAGGRVFFAGEATHPDVNSCVQGAVETGRRAAAEAAASMREARL